MTTPVIPSRPPENPCPVCGELMRRESDGVRNPPMPGIFWFCLNPKCDDGKRNRIYSGG